MKTMCKTQTLFCLKASIKFLAILILALQVMSCGSSKTIQKAPPFHFAGTTFSKEIDSSSNLGVPSAVTDQFSINDKEVYAHLRMENLEGTHKVRWEWYEPSGKLYYATDNTTVKASSGNYLKKCTAWHKLTIYGDKAQTLPGEWELKVFYDNDMLEAKKFSIVAEKAIMASTPLAATQRMFPKDWALIIGIEDYAHLPRVDFARKDALVIKEYFNKILGVPEQNIIALIDSDATKARINGYLKKYIPDNVSKETTLYVYFAGHGAPDMKKGEPYLVPYDGDTLFIEETSYRLKDFYKAIYDLEVNQAYVFLDSCFSGMASQTAEMLTKGSRPALLHVEDVGLATQEVISISAASSNQTSNPLPKEEHGLFTFYLLSALKGKADTNEDRFITIKEIYDYVSMQVTRVAKRMGKDQTPVISPAIEDIKDISVSRVNN
jgi:caspase domain-containing protein